MKMPILKPTDCAVVIPAFNESRTIRRVVEQALSYCPNVIVVDDGSSDGTADHLKDLPITLIRNEKNMGKGFSLLVGFSRALEKPIEAVITIDADGQHNPSDIDRLIRAAQQYSEHFIIGARLRNQQFSPRYRLRANQVADFFISLAGRAWIKDTQSGFRLYPASFLKKIKFEPQKNGRFVLESKTVIEASNFGYPISMLPIDAKYPSDARKSHYKSISDTVRIGLMISQQLLKKGFRFKQLYKLLRAKGEHNIIFLE